MSTFQYSGGIELSAADTPDNRLLIQRILYNASGSGDNDLNYFAPAEARHAVVKNGIYKVVIDYDGEREYGFSFADSWLDSLSTLSAETHGIVAFEASLDYWGSQDGRIHADNSGIYDRTLDEMPDQYEDALSTAKKLLHTAQKKLAAGDLKQREYALIQHVLTECFDDDVSDMLPENNRTAEKIPESVMSKV